MPSAFAARHDRRIVRSHLYEISYWSVALYLAAGLVTPGFVPEDLHGLLFLAAALCACISLHLGMAEAEKKTSPLAAKARAGWPGSDQSLKVELERTRRKAGPYAVVLAELNRGAAQVTSKQASAMIAAAEELLRRYLLAECPVLRLQGERVAAIIPGVAVYEVERMLDRLQEDMRGWTRASPGLELTVGVVADRSGSADIDEVMRDLHLAVRRAIVYRRNRFVVTED